MLPPQSTIHLRNDEGPHAFTDLPSGTGTSCDARSEAAVIGSYESAHQGPERERVRGASPVDESTVGAVPAAPAGRNG